MRTYMSFGGGVQSTAITMLALNKDPRLLKVTNNRVPEMYVFSDTGDERQATYDHVWNMAKRITEAGCVFLITYTGRLSDHVIEKALSGGKGSNTLPFFILDTKGNPAPVKRGCTSHYKIKQLDKAVKKFFDVRKSPKGSRGGYLDEPVEQWLGISYDEVQRMKVSVDQWRTIAHPLIDMRWRRSMCLEYLLELGIPAIRSSCVYCPFHGDKEWREVQACEDDWDLAVKVDRALEAGFAKHGHMGGLQDRPYLNRRLSPIEQIDFSDNQMALFELECAGVCGV